ncbi:hypothetical protein AB205_0141300, partial [Aquarana catesbeiana]
GDKKHKKPVLSSYGGLCEVVSPEKSAPYPASCKGYDQVCGSAVTPGNRKSIWPAGDVGKSKKDAMLPRFHVGASACESTAKKGQRPQLKLSTPPKENCKTVAVEVMGKTDCGIAHPEVEVIPEGRSTVGAEKDLPHCSTLSSGGASVKIECDDVKLTKEYDHTGIEIANADNVLNEVVYDRHSGVLLDRTEVWAEVPEGTSICDVVGVINPKVKLDDDDQVSGQLLREDHVAVELRVSDVAMVDNNSTLCDSPPGTALQNTGEMSSDKCGDILDNEEKCNALVNVSVTMSNDKNKGRPDGQGDMVAVNLKKYRKMNNGMTDTEQGI